MKDLINSIIKNQNKKYFEFELSEGNSVKKLKKATKLVPNLSGIYLVFSEGLSESNHLNFKISDKNYSLLYFGKAGGITNSGRVIIQGLNSRINNVVSDSTRGMKDVKRAKYWNEIMLEFGIEKLYVVCHIHDNPQQLENNIYCYLDNNNLEYPLMNKKRGRFSIKNRSEVLKKNKKKTSQEKNTNKKNNSTFNQTNEYTKLLNSLNIDKLKNDNSPKLLIIGCSNSKSVQSNSFYNNYDENYNFGNEINSFREIRKNYYIEIPINYFNGQNRNGNIVGKPYFMNALNNNPQIALELYGSNQSPFYNPQIKGLYRLKIETSNLHLLIISGLYGLVKHSDYINDYHIEIYKGRNIWLNSITNAINQYIKDNQIDHNSVFYSLSDNYLNKINPNTQWKNLWIKNSGSGSLTSSAKFLKEYFLPNL